MGDLVELERYRSSQTPAGPRDARPEPPAAPPEQPVGHGPSLELTPPDPERFGWVVIGRDAQSDPVRWFHPGRVMQLGYVPTEQGWVLLDDAQQVRAWSESSPGQIAEALYRGVQPALY